MYGPFKESHYVLCDPSLANVGVFGQWNKFTILNDGMSTLTAFASALSDSHHCEDPTDVYFVSYMIA